MPRKPVFTEVMSVVERRIAEGDYMLMDLPGERKLAEEVGVSYMTARKAISQLIEKQVLTRRPNGTLVIHPRLFDRDIRAQVAMLTPAYPSAHFVHCRLMLARAAEHEAIQFRPVDYTHWHDPAVKEALEGSDGLIVIPSTEPIPPAMLRAFAAPENKVVFFDDDMTEQGIPSIRLFAPEHIAMLFEHLWNLGHRRIDCLNAQGRNNEIDRRIAHWRDWLSLRGGDGTLYDTPAEPFTDPTSRAHHMMREVLRERGDRLGAIVCTTQPAAIGAIRACCDLRVKVGRDVSICTINNEPSGRYLCPSLTGLEMPDLEAVCKPVYDWFADGGETAGWPGGLRIVPNRPVLLEGESTGPPSGD